VTFDGWFDQTDIKNARMDNKMAYGLVNSVEPESGRFVVVKRIVKSN
jgi:hypothetical protein